MATVGADVVLPLPVQIFGVFAPVAAALIAGAFLLINASRQRRADRIKNLVDIAEKIPRGLDSGYTIQRAIIEEINGLAMASAPANIFLRWYTYVSLLLMGFFSAATFFPQVFKLPPDVQSNMPTLAIGFPIFWFVSYVVVFAISFLFGERHPYVFRTAALFELDLKRDTELEQIKQRHQEYSGWRKLSKRYEELDALLFAHGFAELIRVLLRARKKLKKAKKKSEATSVAEPTTDATPPTAPPPAGDS